MTPELVDKGRVIFLIVKKVEALDDYVILTITLPMTLKELCLSLPSGSDESGPPIVPRKFEFIDESGCADIRIRIVRIHQQRRHGIKNIPQTVKQEVSIRENAPLVRRVSASTIPQTPTRITSSIREIQSSRKSPKYGNLRSRSIMLNF
jgi:hypothetical protein